MEENFEELLDLYLDDEIIEEKKNNDELEELKEKVSVKVESVFTTEDSITIGRFVNDYLNIDGDCERLYHSGLKDLNSDYVMGVDNNYANKNPELVKQGYLLLVVDARGKRGTYVNPFYLEELLNRDEVDKEFKSISKLRINDIEKLAEYYNKYMELKTRVDNNQKLMVYSCSNYGLT